mmetsp:Transcript_27500/g.40625  ORF Transcript_27500/g.40625 Transcript_27500/m.40625 type:complete len:611 (+) Transcript_27500:105-1937(+)
MKFLKIALCSVLVERSAAFVPSSKASLSTLRMQESDGDTATLNPFASFAKLFEEKKKIVSTAQKIPKKSAAEAFVRSFIDDVNGRKDRMDLVNYFDDEVQFVDTAFYNPVEGKDALLRHFYLHADSSGLSTFSEDSQKTIVVDNVAASNDETSDVSKVCVLYHLEEGGVKIPDGTAITFYNLKNDKIYQVFDATEPPSPKPADSGLKLLKTVSKFIGDESIVLGDKNIAEKGSSVEKYFDAWNRRDMLDAVSNFADDCVIRDSQFEKGFEGKEEFERHLLIVEECLPNTFNFVIDDIALTSNNAGVSWHVENGGDALSFTRGASFYEVDKLGLISKGIEIPEKAPPKNGLINTISSKFQKEPIRCVPVAIWAAYMYILFFSEGILPGVNALQLEQRTWEEVRDLSLNFFLVSPILNLPFSPVVHPMLEGVFNLLLAWAAMFAGFLSDERKNKPNLLPLGLMLVGMQFLTSGFLLPYLFTRSVEKEHLVYKEDIDGELQAKVGEWKPLGPFLATVGSYSIIWAFIGRPEFGEFDERCSSFIDLLSIDRVGSSFLVDLAIFAVFQSWFIDDDLKRRGVPSGDEMLLRNIGKVIPFFGLAYYLSFRPTLPSRD